MEALHCSDIVNVIGSFLFPLDIIKIRRAIGNPSVGNLELLFEKRLLEYLGEDFGGRLIKFLRKNRDDCLFTGGLVAHIFSENGKIKQRQKSGPYSKMSLSDIDIFRYVKREGETMDKNEQEMIEDRASRIVQSLLSSLSIDHFIKMRRYWGNDIHRRSMFDMNKGPILVDEIPHLPFEDKRGKICGIKVQLITAISNSNTTYKDTADYAENTFDMPCCMIGYDGRRLFLPEKAIDALITKKMVIDYSEDRNYYWVRAKKYSNKGYEIKIKTGNIEYVIPPFISSKIKNKICYNLSSSYYEKKEDDYILKHISNFRFLESSIFRMILDELLESDIFNQAVQSFEEKIGRFVAGEEIKDWNLHEDDRKNLEKIRKTGCDQIIANMDYKNIIYQRLQTIKIQLENETSCGGIGKRYVKMILLLFDIRKTVHLGGCWNKVKIISGSLGYISSDTKNINKILSNNIIYELFLQEFSQHIVPHDIHEGFSEYSNIFIEYTSRFRFINKMAVFIDYAIGYGIKPIVNGVPTNDSYYDDESDYEYDDFDDADEIDC